MTDGRASTTTIAWSSNWLVVYLFVVSLAGALWVAVDATRCLAWVAALLLAFAIARYPFVLETPPRGVRPGLRDAIAAAIVSLPAALNLALTWRQEFPVSGDHAVHDGLALEAYALWVPFGWLIAVVAIVLVIRAVRRNPASRLPLFGVAAVAALGLLGFRGAFSVQYPALLHFASVPFRALIPHAMPIDIERLVNALSIPAWLLLLRPMLIGRRVDIAALTTGFFLFWQRDFVYYFTSSYLEPWALVLLLTSGEHLLRFRAEAIWRPLLLIGSAAMVKEYAILALPIVAAVFLSRRLTWPYVATCATAAMPFIVFAANRDARLWSARGYMTLGEAMGPHAAQWWDRVSLQFGAALPLLALATLALLVLAFRNRGATAIAIAAAANAAYFFFALRTRVWAGYPRLNLASLVFLALALGFVADRIRWRGIGAALIAAIVVTYAGPLTAMIASDRKPADARNFFEHFDAPIYYPVREALAHSNLARGTTVEVLNNAKWIWPWLYPGLASETYPDLAAKYRLGIASFTSMPQRCACTSSAAKLAVFVRFIGLGAHLPMRPTMEVEAAECRAAMERTCTRRLTIVHEGVVVGELGVNPAAAGTNPPPPIRRR
ncbi:MAG TPA: hypothetical protein VGJ81_09250 [Thermoanaerobaculia bacterium]